MNDFIVISALAATGSLLGLLGGIVMLFNNSISEFIKRFSLPFALGVLLTVSVTGLIPEAVSHHGNVIYIVVGLAIFFSYILEKIVVHYHTHDHDKHMQGSEIDEEITEGTVTVIMIGDSIHNAIDGIAIAASYFVSPIMGITVAISTFLHELPHEIGDFGLMLKAGKSKRDVLLLNGISALATFLGAYSMILFSSQLESYFGYLMAFAAGIFIYIALFDLLPSLFKHLLNPAILGAILLGSMIMLTTSAILPHDHDHEHDDDHAIETELVTDEESDNTTLPTPTTMIENEILPDSKGDFYIEAETGILENAGPYSRIGESSRGIEAYLGDKNASVTYTLFLDEDSNYDLQLYISDDGLHADGTRNVTITINDTVVQYTHTSADTKGWAWEFIGKISLQSGNNTITFTKDKTTSAAFVMDAFKLLKTDT